jgi:hypothetical protein
LSLGFREAAGVAAAAAAVPLVPFSEFGPSSFVAEWLVSIGIIKINMSFVESNFLW